MVQNIQSHKIDTLIEHQHCHVMFAQIIEDIYFIYLGTACCMENGNILKDCIEVQKLHNEIKCQIKHQSVFLQLLNKKKPMNHLKDMKIQTKGSLVCNNFTKK